MPDADLAPPQAPHPGPAALPPRLARADAPGAVTIPIDAPPAASLALLAEAMPQLVWSARPDGYHDYFNERWYAYTGMPRPDAPGGEHETPQGWNWKRYLHPDDHGRAQQAWRTAVASGEPYEIEYRFREAASGAYRWFLGRALPVRDAGGRITRWVGTCTDVDDARRAGDVLAVLADAGQVLAGARDVERALTEMVRLAVPRLSDWCALDLTVDGDARAVRRVAVAHVDPSRVALAHTLAERYPFDPDAPHGLAAVLRTGTPELLAEIPDALLAETATDAELLAILRALGLRSSVCVPILPVPDDDAEPGPRGPLGALTLVSAEAGRRYGARELAAAEELARRIAAALERARHVETLADDRRRLRLKRAALERQNAQLQEQAVELEMQAAQLQEQATELEAQADDLHLANAALGASEARFRSLFESMTQGVVYQDAAGRIEDANPAAERVLGLTRDQLLGRASPDPRWRAVDAHGADFPGERHPAMVALRTGEVVQGVRMGIHNPADGATRWLSVDAVPERRAGEARPFRVYALFSDVTAQVEAEHERERLMAAERAAREEATRLYERAEEANHAKSQFLRTVSHELRTPLNAVAGYAELLRLGLRGPVTGEQDADLARITRASQHLLGLINDILSFAKLEAGQVELALAEVPVRALLAEVESLVAPQLAAAGLAYDHSACADDLAVRADAERVRQILLNLLGNALKFTPRGGRIAVRCMAEGDAVRIAVADTGVGIPPEALERVFDPFVQVGRELRAPSDGVGLGLAISRDLARRMDGTLTVESRVGAGSTFTLTLPRA